jgi:hypothetical protein
MSTQRKVGSWLLALGIALAIVGGVLWASANSDAAKRSEQAAFNAAASADRAGIDLGGVYPTEKPNHVPSVVLWVIGASAGLFGMMLIAGGS